MMKNWIFLLLAFPLLTFSCRKDLDTITTSTTTYQAAEIIVTASLTGQIVDEAGSAVSNALVRLGNRATVTNENGLYQFQDESMNARGTYVTVVVNGYFPASDRFYPLSGSHHTNRIQLIRKNKVGDFSGLDGGAVSFEEAGITFEANSIANSQGELIEGTVNVAAHWLNPTAENLGDFMPGSLYGFDKNGREVVMTTMGMLAVELTDEAGNEVNIANGRTATVRFPVPAELQSQAPETIPLWHFDETDGIWIEEGSASLQDGVYVGKVSHFSYWNVDIPAGTETVYISGCLEFDNGTAAANTGFHLSYGPELYHVGWGASGDEGEFGGLVPADEVIAFEIYDECGELTVVEVGPFGEDTAIENCLVVPSSNVATITGQMVDCNGLGVNGGAIQIISGGWSNYVIITDEDGNFSINSLSCSSVAELTLIGYDLPNLESTGELSYTVSEDTNIGVITACENPLESYIDNDLDSREVYFFTPVLELDTIEYTPDSLNFYNYSVISAFNINDQEEYDQINIWLTDLDVGSYTGNDVGFEYYIEGDAAFYPRGCVPPCDDITVNITANEGPGGFLTGDYNGTLDGFDNMQMFLEDRPVSGTFRVRIPE